MQKVFFGTPLLFSLGFLVLTGCGSQFQGSLTGRDGDGTGVQPAAGQAQVTSVSPSTAVAGSGSFTLTVNGLNFLPSTTILWDDITSVPTTYVSSTVLKAQVPAELLANPGTVTIAPSPIGTFNFVGKFTVSAASLTGNNSFSASRVSVKANDIVWSPANQQLYLSIAGTNSTSPNTVTALDPQTGALGASISAAQPGRLAVSADGTYLYAGLDSAGLVRRYKLPALQSDIDIPLGPIPSGTNTALHLAVQPTNSGTVAIHRGIRNLSPSTLGVIGIYDNAVARSQSVPEFGPSSGVIDSLVWNPDGQSLYGLGPTATSLVSAMSVSASGIQLQAQVSSTTSLGRFLHFDSTTGKLYSDSGKVVDPATGTVIGSFPLNALQGGLSGNYAMVPDGKLNIAYFVGRTTSGNYVIEAFDLTRLTLIGAIPLTNMTGNPTKIVRWGINGLAILVGGLDAPSTDGDGVYFVSGGFVTSPGQ